jgi:uncharacterized membrane protein YesL
VVRETCLCQSALDHVQFAGLIPFFSGSMPAGILMDVSCRGFRKTVQQAKS